MTKPLKCRKIESSKDIIIVIVQLQCVCICTKLASWPLCFGKCRFPEVVFITSNNFEFTHILQSYKFSSCTHFRTFDLTDWFALTDVRTFNGLVIKSRAH